MAPKRHRVAADSGYPVAHPVKTETTDHTEENLFSHDSGRPWANESSSPNEPPTHMSSESTEPNLDSPGPSRKKSEPVKSACAQCQKRKTKCSGRRPTCGFCSDRGLDCSWEIGDGLTRNADLKQRLAEADMRSADINVLVNDMRNNTDEIATTLLAKLRLGDTIKDLATGIRAGTSFDGARRASQAEGPSVQAPER